MKVTDILKTKKRSLSFEVFPPKTGEAFASVSAAVDGIAALSPDFISVTYGAGGGTSEYSAAIAEHVLRDLKVTPVAHLSCISSDRADVEAKLTRLKEAGVENVLALRGDIPADFAGNLDYTYASELVAEIKERGCFCIGGACYPEGHPESRTLFKDIENLKRKVDAGCDFLTSQMFFDNAAFYSFMHKVREAGITIPVIAGVMPVTNGRQIKRMMALSGCTLPARFRRMIDAFGDDPVAMTGAGIAYATEQIIDLYANGIPAVHVYSMNKPAVAAAIRRNLEGIV